jgi:hypothetical protein
MVNVTSCSLASWLDSSRGDVHIELVQGIHGDEVSQRLTVAVFLKRHVYGRTRRITFTQLIQRQWLQYPVPYNRMSRVVPTPDWFAECEADLQPHVDEPAAAAALADELDDEEDEEVEGEDDDENEESEEEDEGEEDDEVEELDGEVDE